MVKSNIILTPYEDIFSSEESRQDDKRERIMELPLTLLQPFKNHPFHTKQDEELQKLADSIKEYGILTPLIARPYDSGYELISGHRRKAAAELAGIGTLPVLIREMADDAAIILMVDSNIQRENLLPSEKAFAYKMKLEVIKRQGKRTDLSCGQVAHKLKSRDIVADEAGESEKQIRRYIRLTELIPELLQMVDDRQIAFSPAVELSYLEQAEQTTLLATMQEQDCTPSLSQAQRMKKPGHVHKK